MNIIINQDGVRLTQYSASTTYDIDNIRIYVHKDLTKTPTNLELSYTDTSLGLANVITYSAPIEAHAVYNLNDYLGYCINPTHSFTQQPYECKIICTDGTSYALDVKLMLNNDLIDEHNALRIDKRTIVVSNNANLLVAQDSLSQQITFEIKKYYDGVSLLDDSKEVYVDFIPVGYAPVDETQPAFYSDLIIDKEEFEENGESWMRLKWNVPFAVTKKAGQVRIGLAITNVSAGYVWQTVPAIMTVQPNIGIRPAVPVTPSDDFTIVDQIDSRLQTLEEFVANLNNVEFIDTETGTISYTVREDGEETTEEYSVVDLLAADASDEDVVLGGGGVEEVIE